MCKQKEVIELYNVVRDYLKLKSNHGRIMEKEVKSIMGAVYHIPKPFRHIIIDEMLDLGYLKGERQLQKRERMFEVN